MRKQVETAPIINIFSVFKDFSTKILELIGTVDTIMKLSYHWEQLKASSDRKKAVLWIRITEAYPDADPDSTYHSDTNPNSDFYLMLIRIRIFI
jgi:hypothetical protein